MTESDGERRAPNCGDECRCPCHDKPRPLAFADIPEADNEILEFIRRHEIGRRGPQ